MTKTRQPHLTIRSMRRTDAKAVAEMMHELQIFHRDECRVTAKHFITYCLRKNALSQAWVAVVGKTPAGFAITKDWMNFVRAKPTRSLDLLYVDEGFRGHGVGAALIAFIAQESIKDGFLRLDTSASLYNKQANAFYKALGFEPIKHKSNRYGIDGKALKRLSKEIE